MSIMRECSTQHIHCHAGRMREYAQDAFETTRPWERWEINRHDGAGWQPCTDNPIWRPCFSYRRKQETIEINGCEVPKPLQSRPTYGETYFSPAPGREELVSTHRWTGTGHDHRRFSRGLCHWCIPNARVHANALLAPTMGGCDD